jgi:hypothetical protein
MGLIEWYVLFAVTTACAACYELYWPVLKSLQLSHPELQIVQNIWLSMGVFFGLTLLVAPVTILPCVVPSMGERFRHKFWETLLAE